MSRTKRKRLDPDKIKGAVAELRETMLAKVVGQTAAVEAVLEVYQTYLAGLADPRKPLGNLLLVGPTGTGKTHLCEVFAEALTGSVDSLIRIDCAEYQHSHEIAKLIGSPPGYLGHRETHPALSQETLNSKLTPDVKISFVLFDEIEKASDALRKLLLGILDKATLTLGDNRKVNFAKTLVFMSSNLGSASFNRAVSGSQPGFTSTYEKHQKTFDGSVRGKFDPEFVNRLDKIVVFNPLDQEQLCQIVDLEMTKATRMIIENGNTPFLLTADQSAKDYLLRNGTDKRYGAREVRRVIRREITFPVAKMIASGQIKLGDSVEVTEEAGALVFDSVGEVLLPRESIAEKRAALLEEAA